MNEEKLHEFMGRLLNDMGSAATLASVILGEELGLYRALADGNPVTSDELASKTKCNPRLVREWLSAQVASGYVEYADRKFRLPPEQAMALANEDSPVYVAGGVGVLSTMFFDKDRIAAAFRGNGSCSWGEHHPCLFAAEGLFRPGYKANLVTMWLPALEGVVAKLQIGAKVADVGCGQGASTVIMAEAYPKSRFDGFDFHAPSVEAAKQRAAAAGVSDRAAFVKADAKSYPGKDYDLVCFFDCLHDMGDPVGAARHAFAALKPSGTVLLVEPYANDKLEQNVNPIARMYYAASTFICTPNALSQDVGLALGAQAGEARLRSVFNGAGFKTFRRVSETPFNLILEARK